jgi:glycosyltransferase involved in cell wall biosynthesis
MRLTSPRVSAVIPVFNGERTIARAIDSVLAQRYDGEIEIVVVNDGSTDSTAEVLRGYGNRIKVMEQPNRGTPASRNAGVRASSGKYLAFLDADDFWLPDKLQMLVDVLERDPDCVLAYSEVFQVTPDGARLETAEPPAETHHAPSMDDLFAKVWPILPSAAVMRRTAFDQSGGACEQFGRYSWGEDSYFFMLVREHGAFAFVPDRIVGKEEILSRDRTDAAIAGYDVFRRLVIERYGGAARGLVADIERVQANHAVGAGLTALRAGDCRAALKRFGFALRKRPHDPKILARYLFAFLPAPFSRGLLSLAPARIRTRILGSSAEASADAQA